jgi:hypothetical protein
MTGLRFSATSIVERTHFYPDMPFDWVWEIKYIKKKDEKNTALIDVKYLSVLFIGKSKVETEKYPLLSCRKNKHFIRKLK